MSRIVAFQGVSGAYSELAIMKYFGNETRTTPCREFRDTFRAVINREANYGVLPIENTLTGSIHQNYELLKRKQLWIVGEVTLPILHALVAIKGTTLSQVRKVYSHPQALWQCQKYLQKLRRADLIPFFDTAGSAKWIQEQKDPQLAAVASQLAAKRYGLKVLGTDIQDHRNNFTRFLVLARNQKHYQGPKAKTSIVFALRSVPGALHHSLGVFADNGIQLIKLESRPIPGKPWEYLFYLDFEGHCEAPAATKALMALKKGAKQIRLLGSYRAAK